MMQINAVNIENTERRKTVLDVIIMYIYPPPTLTMNKKITSKELGEVRPF